MNRLWNLFQKSKRQRFAKKMAVEPWALDRILFSFGNSANITIGNACEGIFITGGIGSGKSSGSGYLTAMSFLDAGFGGLVLTAKPGECESWIGYCARAGRLDDLIIFGPEQPHRFNFLDFELSRKGRGAGLSENIINVLTTIVEVAEKTSNKSGQGGDQYWGRALRQLLRNATDLLILSQGRVTVPDMYRIVISAPSSLDQVGNTAFKERSFCYQCLDKADKMVKNEEQAELFKVIADYFLLEMATLSDKTRSVIVSTFTSMADVLNRGVLKTLFSGETTVTPEDIENGKIIVVDLPVKQFGDVGLFANILWKNCFQRSIERRDVRYSPRVTFLFQDEGQIFVTDYDMIFQSTSRSSRVATVILTQSISNFYAVSGDGQKGKAQVDSLIGNMNLRFMHGNGDAVTNQYCSELIGKTRQVFFNGSTSDSAQDAHEALFGGGGQTSGGYSEQMDFEVNPNTFLRMRNGTKANNYLVDALMFSPVMRFGRDGKNFLPVTFKQSVL